MNILPFEIQHVNQVQVFSDLWIGKNYFLEEDLVDLAKRSQFGGKNCSFLCFKNEELVGIRLSYAPGKWPEDLVGKSSPHKYKYPLDTVGYFKSLFLNEKFQGKGVGGKLSNLGIEKMREMKAKAIVTHCWLESPNQSSERYLSKLGFEPVNDIPLFWKDIDYLCSGCAIKPCKCTAREMILYL